MIRRRLEPLVRASLKGFPAVVLLGTHQVGKTTFARSILRGMRGRALHLDLERPADLARIAEPESYLARIFHEVRSADSGFKR